jgi:hypothetical protein
MPEVVKVTFPAVVPFAALAAALTVILRGTQLPSVIEPEAGSRVTEIPLPGMSTVEYQVKGPSLKNI